jgi:hypothetical protein
MKLEGGREFQVLQHFAAAAAMTGSFFLLRLYINDRKILSDMNNATIIIQEKMNE